MNYDFSTIYAGKVGNKRRQEYLKRLSTVAEHYTNGDLSHAALLVDNWKNGCFNEGDECLSFTDQTFNALDALEKKAYEVGKVRRFLESKALYGTCYEFDAFSVIIHRLMPDGTLDVLAYDGNDRACADIKVEKEEIEVISLLNPKSPQRAIYKLDELERFYEECLEPHMRSGAEH